MAWGSALYNHSDLTGGDFSVWLRVAPSIIIVTSLGVFYRVDWGSALYNHSDFTGGVFSVWLRAAPSIIIVTSLGVILLCGLR